MQEKKILLSICIPTYNRCSYLKNTLDSIVKQEVFLSGEIEVIINDNCSTDDTKIISEEYAAKYGSIHYYCNDVNVYDKNFPICLSRASGLLKKLHNDTLLFNKGSLQYLLRLVKDNLQDKPIVFFLNNGSKNRRVHQLDDFMYLLSFNVTYIGGFSIWEESNEVSGNYYGCDKHLWQVPCLLTSFTKKNNAIVVGKNLFQNQNIHKKDISYGLFQVFYSNFLSLIQDFVTTSQLSQECFQWIEEDLLFNFFIKWIVISEMQRNAYVYSKSEELKKKVEEAYSDRPYFERYKKAYEYEYRVAVLKGKYLKIGRLVKRFLGVVLNMMGVKAK